MPRSFFLLIIFLFSFFFSTAQIETVTETPAGISRRLQHEIDITKDPQLGYVPKSRLVDAYKFKKEKIKENQNKKNNQSDPASNLSGTITSITDGIASMAAATGFTWAERGPFKDAVGPSNGNTRAGNAITSGRVRAVFEDADGVTVWVGGVDGGLWKTTNITSSPATWTPINDFFSNMAIASICQDPTDPNIMYFGTGEKAVNADAVRGAGIWKSTDHGLTWNIMTGTEAFWNVSKVVCDKFGNLYVACNAISNNKGLQRLTKSTGVWTEITPSGLDKRVTEMILSSNGKLHISCGYYNTATASAGYRFTASPESVTPTTWTSPLTTFTTQYNVALASKGDTLYALPSTSAWQVTSIFKSVNGGLNWTATTTTPAFTSGQAWYCMAIAVDPKNANNVIVGSLDCYKTTNGGGTWTKISEWVGTAGQYVHADQQIILWNSSNQVLVGSDGGIHYSADGGATFKDKNDGLRIKQFYSVAIHPTTADYFLGGTQDNGTHQLNAAGLASSVEVTGGDGAFVHIDQNQPAYQWGSYVYNQYRRSTNSGGAWSSINYSSSIGRFINPTDYDDVNNIMYCSGSSNAFLRWSNPQSGSTFTSVSMTGLNTGTVSAIKVSPFTAHRVYFGGTNGTLLRAVGANLTTPTITSIKGNANFTSNVSSIETGTDDANLIVTISNYGVQNVWVTKDGGTTWTAIDGNLPDMPVRWAMFYPGNNTKAIIATETGVWQTALINGASTVWDPEPTFPNVRVDMLQYRASDRLLAAATHGRGIFTTNIPAPVLICGDITGLNAGSITTTGSTISWATVAGALNYDVEYKLSTSATWTVAATGTTALTQVLTGLQSGSLYDVRVRSNCTAGAGNYASIQFSTLVVCATVTGLTSSSVTASGATITWSALNGATGYNVDYKANSVSTWTNRLTNSTALTTTLTGLTASTLYDYRVQGICPSGTGPYGTAQFTTTAPCPGVYDISTNGTASGAGAIPLNTDVKGTISSSTDIDFYKFSITTAGTATITLTTLPANYALTLYASNGTTQLATSNLTSTSNETINYTFAVGTYVIKVNGVSKAFNASSCYTLRVTRGTATGADLQLAELTGYKANSNNVTELTSAITVKLFPNPAKDKVTLYLMGSNEKRFLQVYDARGKKIYDQEIKEMFTTLSMQKVPAGLYFFRVTSEKGQVLYNEKLIRQ
jgi:hypothetical protein